MGRQSLHTLPILCMLLAILALARASESAQHAPYPAPDSGYVTDLAGVLSADQQERIERWLWQVEQQTKVEIAVVTIQSLADYPRTDNGSIEAFGRGLFNTWGIGNKPKNDGVLLLVCVGDRRVRIQPGAGYGTSRRDAAQRIIDRQILPRFREDDHAGGIEAGVKAIVHEFAGVRIGWNWPLMVMMAAIPIGIVLAVSLFRSGKRGWGWICVGAVVILILAVVQLIHRTLRALPNSSSDSWDAGGDGGWGGGDCGGGGGGDGGASGSW